MLSFAPLAVGQSSAAVVKRIHRSFSSKSEQQFSSSRRPTTNLFKGPYSSSRNHSSSSKPTQSRSTITAMAAPNELITDADAAVDFAGALPKAEIQATQFLEQYPEYDGRNVVIAIFDTGVDPGAFGLQTTPDGRPKIIDVVDCTGSGDVNTSKVVTADENGYIESLLGNKLKLNSEWKNPSGEWRVGAAPAFSLLPGGLKHRLKEERRKRFDEQQRGAVTKATAALVAFEAAHGRAPATATPAEIKQREELEARMKLLEELSSKYEDQGPMVEAVVWNDGEKWVAALDTSDFYAVSVLTNTDGKGEEEEGGGESERIKGALANFGEPLTNFRACRRYGTFSAEDACNYVINIYDEGNTLSIVVDAGSHGTHVAGIAAGYHPEDPFLNGIAPGAQIVSCKIGDTRLGSMETNVGLTRALITVLENKCDLINMSYGEATATSNAGRFVRLADEIVNKHGVIFVASAGNAGPALSTVGAPGGTSSAVLGIGAFVTPALAAAGHSIRKALDQGTQYTWSSRGPAPDGDIGVTFSAPGGAIAPVPQWSQQKMQLMNGTSMASPCACGGLALVLSALKAEGQAITPARVRRAVENTALVLHPDDPTSTLTYGRGLLQVADTFKYLQQGSQTKSYLDNDILKDLVLETSVRRSDSASTTRGVYLRDPADAANATTWSVEIKPRLKEDADVKSSKLEIDLKIKMKATASWITAPELLLLHHNGRSFEVEIDPTGLEQGLHYAEIQGFDAVDEWRGPLFRIPVTVIKPLMLAALPGSILAPAGANASNNAINSTTLYEPHGAVVDLGNESFVPGKEMRRFVGVPAGATWAELKLKASESTTTQKAYMVRATALLPHTRYSDSEYRTYTQLPPHSGESISTFAVHSGTTLEITIAQFWSSLGDSSLKMELTFHGIDIKTNSGSGNGASGANGVVIDGAGGTVKVIARAPLLREKIKPSAKLDTVRIPLRPTDAGVLAPLRAPRDVLPGGRTIHSLLLSYKLSLQEGGKVTPRVPLLNRYVYDSEIEAQMSFTRDENKQLLGVGDIYPDAITLKKGEYTISLVLRHEEPAVLEKLRTLPMLIERKLENAIQVPVYNTNGDSVLGKDAVTKERPLCAGEAVALFLGPVPDDKMPKDASSGRSLVGSFSLGQTSAGKDAPGAVSMTYLVPPKKADAPTTTPTAAAGAAGTTSALSSTPESGLFEAVRDAEVKYLSGMKTDTDETQAAYSKLLLEFNQKYPDHLPLLREPLKRLASKPAAERATPETVSAIISAADNVLAAIDNTALAVFVAAKCPDESEGAADRKKEMEEKKSAVVEALAAKCSALLEKEGSKVSDEFETCYAQLRRWVDPVADATHAPLAAKREERAGRTALALKAMEKAVSPDDKPATKEVLERREELLRALGWEHWAYMEKMKKRMAFPVWTQQ
jgi:tripeptidyl-peptidase II